MPPSLSRSREIFTARASHTAFCERGKAQRGRHVRDRSSLCDCAFRHWMSLSAPEGWGGLGNRPGRWGGRGVGGGFKAGPGSSWRGNVPLATTSRPHVDTHHSSHTYTHTHTHRRNPRTHINILRRRRRPSRTRAHVQSACISKINSRKNKIGHGGAIFHRRREVRRGTAADARPRVNVHVCVCVFSVCTFFFWVGWRGYESASLAACLQF